METNTVIAIVVVVALLAAGAYIMTRPDSTAGVFDAAAGDSGGPDRTAQDVGSVLSGVGAVVGGVGTAIAGIWGAAGATSGGGRK